MGNNLKALREHRGWTQDEAAEAMGMSRGGYIKIERGENQLTSSTIARAAEIFGVNEANILAPSSVIPIVALVSAGGGIETAWENLSEPLAEIEIPFHLGEDVIGFRIVGDSMWPKYDPDDVVVVARAGEPLESLLGWEAVVKTGDGDRYFKRIVRGARPHAYDLESYNAPTIRAREITWASGRIATVPAARWRMIERKAAKPKARKAKTA